MKTITKIITALFIAATLTIANTNAQGLKGNKNNNSSSSGGGQSGYKTGIGLRGGFEGGITVKHFIKSGRAIEGILSRGWGYGGMRITGLYEIHKPFPGAKGLDWFYGVGAHIGFYDEGYYNFKCDKDGYWYKGNWYPGDCRGTYTTIGIDGILGLEYQFAEIPFTIGLDIKPYFDFVGRSNHYGDGAFSIRYTIK